MTTSPSMFAGANPPAVANNHRMGMSFGIHSLLGLAAARDMQPGTYISAPGQYCHQAAFFPHNPPQLFTMEMPQTSLDRAQYEAVNPGDY